MITTKTALETKEFAKKIGERLKSEKILYLTGDLGSGKTTFTKGIAEYLGIDHFTIKSPTYTYIRKHVTPDGDNFYHIDLYRIESVDELLMHEIEEIMEAKNSLIVIEWADRLPEKSHEGINIVFKYKDASTREIKVNE
ncbi:tRNA (adenosine(37)-N6)-threonylcarbamoyltransferase complex ATPase subunit type 1 TsaE [Candidatus Peregrinibacteria bacterium]|jgi:tRNA threonylcarbamoyladenosine biosynthesis protein TsaE|nr:tRNA (adenosine(37)-N6)-threonylcarbamoyltransferase complex ATPase subunit type 1 TsaE [Candidatus Peregrinibacteria bacterium]MBT7736953.1 tRNA (adenosine(37)-N6)-threonylcarbamoyltransferase complex ATPase subunit type 1 TsaE [Candidatus Peregrinibacteria bacterium]